MGLIKAGIGALGGTLADQWKMCIRDSIAPAFGADDAQVGRKYGLPFLQLVDNKGKMTAETPWAGLFCKDADKEIIKDLNTRGRCV